MESVSESCHSCKATFNKLLRSKVRCKVCGKSVCKSCSTKDLLVYIPDEEKSVDMSADTVPMPKLAIIKIVGVSCEY